MVFYRAASLTVIISLFHFAVLGSKDTLQIPGNKTNPELPKYEAYHQIGADFYETGEFDSAIVYYNMALQLVSDDNKEKKARIVLDIAYAYNWMEKMDEAIFYYRAVEKLYRQISASPEKTSALYVNMGRTFYEKTAYDSAMVYYNKAREIFEENEIYNEAYGTLFHYIGSVYKRQRDMDRACEYYQKQIDYGLRYGFPKIVAEGNYLSADCSDDPVYRLQRMHNALQIYQSIESTEKVALMYNNLAVLYHESGDLDSACYFQNLAIDFERNFGKRSHLTTGLTNLASMYIKMQRYAEAKDLLKEAEVLAHDSQSKRLNQLKHVNRTYAELYYATGDYKKAYHHQTLQYIYQDSTIDQEHKDLINEMEVAYDTKNKEAEIAKLELTNKQKQFEKDLAETEAKRQSFNNKLYLLFGICTTLLMIVLYFKWRKSNQQQLIISEQKREVEHQKSLVEVKNKDIIDSMIYASSIQRAMIVSEEYISGIFEDYFVLYKPRDIVSGDFYWAHQTKDKKRLIAVGDCTGHGVPGAMMSMLGTAFLNEIVIEGDEINPGAILDKLRIQIKKAMSSKGGKDGMDIAICCIDGNNFSYAAANLPIYLIRENELTELKGDKQPVGAHPGYEIPFSTHQLETTKGDKFYFFSDGYADQFGGVKGKKYKYKTLKNKLLSLSHLPLSENKQELDSEFQQWKGNLEQVDDVCVIGVRV